MIQELLAYLNGKFLPASHAAISLDDLGFIFGAVVTDRLRTFRNQLFRLDDHLKRFRRGCDEAFIPQPRSDAELAEAANELIRANAQRAPEVSDWSLIVFATPGAGAPTLGMQAKPIDFERYSHLFSEGAILAPVALGPPPIDPLIKHRSRLAWWIAQKELTARTASNPKTEPLFTTSAAAIRETPTANFLCEIDGALVSPPRAEILNGISLMVVEELCQKLGIAFQEREILLEEASVPGRECLLTNSSYCIASVSRIGEHSKPFNSRLFIRLINEWSDFVGVKIREQFFTKR